MTIHRAVDIAFVLSVLSVLLTAYFYDFSLWWLLLVVVLYLFVLMLGTVRIGMRFFLQSYTHGSRKDKMVALTFDDGPDLHTAEVADCLSRHGVTGAFFLIGHKVVANPEVVKKLHEAGHVVGNHGYHHRWNYPLRPTREIQEEMRLTSVAIKDATGLETHFFRPPFGITNPRIAKAVRAQNLISVGWDVRSFDTVLGTSQRFSNRLKRKVRNGSIILLHDTGEGMVGFLDSFIPWLKEQGYQIVSLEILIHEKAYQ